MVKGIIFEFQIRSIHYDFLKPRWCFIQFILTNVNSNDLVGVQSSNNTFTTAAYIQYFTVQFFVKSNHLSSSYSSNSYLLFCLSPVSPLHYKGLG